MLLLLHSTFVLSVVKMLLKGEVGGHALNIHGNYIIDHGIVFLKLCGNPVTHKELKQGTKIFQYCTCPAGRVTRPANVYLTFKSVYNKEHKGVICTNVTYKEPYITVRFNIYPVKFITASHILTKRFQSILRKC